MRSEGGRNDGYPVLGFGESQQGMWRASFEPNVGSEAREAAGCVKGPAKAVPIVQKEQWVRCEARNLDRALAAKRRRWMARGKELSRFQCLAPELPVV
jgi:hypothetical protein